MQIRRPRTAGRFPVMVLLAALLSAANPPIFVQAGTGDLDLTFGVNGRINSDFFGLFDNINDLAIQSDGKIVAVGSAQLNPFGADFGLARYNVNGSLDPTFGSGGKLLTDFFQDVDEGSSVAIQPDGKIVAAGSATHGFALERNTDFALARYNSDGSLDTSFGSEGRVTTDFVSGNDGISDLAIDGQGKIVVGGFARNTSVSFGVNFALARYNSDGSLDPAFGAGGRVLTDFFGFNDAIGAIAIQSDGKIIAAGTAFAADGSDEDFALARYNGDGSLDTTFGSSGKVTTDIFGGIDELLDMVLQPDGKIVATGLVNPPGALNDFTLLRYNSDGSIDTTFGAGGKTTTDFSGGTDISWALALQSDGGIVVAGYTLQGPLTYRFALARYKPDGSLDTGFGTGGRITTQFRPDGFALAFAVAIQSDGRIIAGGLSTPASFITDFALARYQADGTSTFDICLQDDSNGSSLRFNSATGDYELTNCAGSGIRGRGSVIKKGGIITLQDYSADRRVLARIDTAANRGSATVTIFSSGVTFTIADRNTSNSSCICR